MTYFYAPISIFDLSVQSPEALPNTHTTHIYTHTLKLERVHLPAIAREIFGYENKLRAGLSLNHKMVHLHKDRDSKAKM